jgi:pimeloyl-ACP methyl ester carboxylesterase
MRCEADPGSERRPEVQRARIDGSELAYDVTGSGNPVLLIHGSVLADAFLPLLAEPGLADRYRVITYHRRGYGRSARAIPPLPIARQAADARSLLAHLGIERAHVVGRSTPSSPA